MSFPTTIVQQTHRARDPNIVPGGKMSAAKQFLLFQGPRTPLSTYEPYPTPTILFSINLRSNMLHSRV